MIINSRTDVIHYVHSILDRLEIAEWKIGSVSLWKLRGHIGKAKKFASVLLYEPNDDHFYFITSASLQKYLNLVYGNETIASFTDWDEWPCARSLSEEDYFQKMVSVDTNIEVIDTKISLLLSDMVDKITSSDIYKEKNK